MPYHSHTLLLMKIVPVRLSDPVILQRELKFMQISGRCRIPASVHHGGNGWVMRFRDSCIRQQRIKDVAAFVGYQRDVPSNQPNTAASGKSSRDVPSPFRTDRRLSAWQNFLIGFYKLKLELKI